MAGILSIGGQNYRIGTKMNALQQFHVSRRLGPVVWAIGVTAFQGLMKGAQALDAMGLEGFSKVVGVFASMSDEDCDYVLHQCLATVQRQSGPEVWGPIMVDGRMQFNDIQLPQMMQLTLAVLQENMGGFFPERPELTSTALSSGNASAPVPS